MRIVMVRNAKWHEILREKPRDQEKYVSRHFVPYRVFSRSRPNQYQHDQPHPQKIPVILRVPSQKLPKDD